MNTLLKGIISHLPGVHAMDRHLWRRYTGQKGPEIYPPGHFYSPCPDLESVRSRATALWSKDVDRNPSLQLGPDAQTALIKELARFYTDFTWPDQPYPDYRYYLANSWFGHGDAISLYGVLRYFRPNRVIEMGSGFSSALMLDTNEKFLAHAVRFTCIDPFPERLRSLLRDADRQNVGVVPDIVQNVPIATFSERDANDILFVDSLPVAKIGSDVNYLIFEILPALKPGVLVHFHDILWPFEYPLEWVLAGTAWNETYVVRAFLQYNHMFEVLLFNSYLGDKFTSLFEALMPSFLKDIGGSLWLRKRGVVDSALCDS